MEKRSHLFTRGRGADAAMLNEYRLSREGSVKPRSDAKRETPFPTSLREPIELRRNANLNYLPPVFGPTDRRRNAIRRAPNFHQFWATPVTPKGQTPLAQF